MTYSNRPSLHRSNFRRLAVLVLLSGIVGCKSADHAVSVGPTTITRHAAVASVSKPASEVGVRVLKRGGNAVDAAVATAFALAVTFPEAGNIGGGGFMLIRPADGRSCEMIDYREAAPGAATVDMFVKRADRTEWRMVGVPGTVAGLWLAHQRRGKLPWRDLVEPAVGLARDGFILNQDCANSFNRAIARPGDEADELRRVLSKPGGGRWNAGDRVIQPELGHTLSRIATEGPDAFYVGEIPEAIVETLKPHRGLIATTDLSTYKAKVRDPLKGTYRGYDILAPAPPSSGGVVLIEMLNILETFDLKQQGRWSAETLHLMTEAMRRAYADRARYLGDPDFVTIPPKLTTKDYAKELAATIDPEKATPSADVAPEIKLADSGSETTHFGVLDESGMAVSNTYTLEKGWGGRIMVKGKGFLLNDEMGDFNPVPGATTRGGQIGTDANLVAPRKRMLSSMTPVIVSRNGKLVMITGSPGGRTIINTLLCVLINRLDFEMSPRQTVDAPRMTHQWFPDVLNVEPGLAKQHADALEAMRKMGHRIPSEPKKQGDAHTIFVTDDGTIHAIADDRRSGTAAGY